MNDLQKRFTNKALEWVGLKVPYLHRGVTKLGCDCTGLIIGIARDLGFLGKYELRMYPIDWNIHSGAGNYIIEELIKVADEIPKSSAVEGDILVFRFAKCLAHVGILVNRRNGKFIHSYVDSKKCCFGILNNSSIGKRWVKSFRLNTDKMRRFA